MDLTRRRWMLTALVAWGVAGCGKSADPSEPQSSEGPIGAAADTALIASREAAARAKRAPVSGESGARKLRRNPNSPDPILGPFNLAQATQGLPGEGELGATITTDVGELTCTLYPDKAPITVANFVGLARGVRPFWDPTEAAWVQRAFYDGTTFHRVAKGFMIQGGDQLGTGSGEVGYEIPDEIWPGTRHDRAGLLCMANKGPNTNGGQFFITDAAALQLTKAHTYTIFGECKPLALVHRIASAALTAKGSERPKTPVKIERVTIIRR